MEKKEFNMVQIIRRQACNFLEVLKVGSVSKAASLNRISLLPPPLPIFATFLVFDSITALPAPQLSLSLLQPVLNPNKMLVRRDLFISSIALLRLASTFRPDPQNSRVFVQSFYVFANIRVPIPLRNLFFPSVRALRLCSSLSESAGGGGGEPAAGTCWNCGAAGGSSGVFLACGSCRSVQPVDPSVDYFKIFGLERAYDIKDDNLEGKYKDWQKKLHPDLVHTKSEKEKTFAAEQSARVIDAYRTLNTPLSRALYLLQLEGVHVNEEQTLTDPELLAEMMDMREAVEEASDSQALKHIESQIQKKLEAWSSSFNEAFNKRDFDNAIAATQRMRYYERAIEEIVKKS